MSALAATLKAGRPRPISVPCRVSVILPLLDDEDTEALIDAIATPTITAISITKALRDEGHELPAASITRHRRKECRCDVS